LEFLVLEQIEQPHIDTMTIPTIRSDFKNAKPMSYDVALRISQQDSLHGDEARDSMRRHLATMSNRAAEEGLTEADVMQLLRDE
jgi:hypothetical protein